MIISCDFDGVIVENKFPSIGKPNKSIIRALRVAYNAGNHVIIFTGRSNHGRGRMYLNQMKRWMRKNGVPSNAINKDFYGVKDGIRLRGGKLRKPIVDVMIDDRDINWRGPEDAARTLLRLIQKRNK